MNRDLWMTLLVLLGTSPIAAAVEGPAKAPTPAEEVQAIAKDFNGEGFALRQAKTDAEREQIVARVDKLTQRALDLADKYPRDPAALDALVQAVVHEIWMENNTPHIRPPAGSPEARAIAILL